MLQEACQQRIEVLLLVFIVLRVGRPAATFVMIIFTVAVMFVVAMVIVIIVIVVVVMLMMVMVFMTMRIINRFSDRQTNLTVVTN